MNKSNRTPSAHGSDVTVLREGGSRPKGTVLSERKNRTPSVNGNSVTKLWEIGARPEEQLRTSNGFERARIRSLLAEYSESRVL